MSWVEDRVRGFVMIPSVYIDTDLKVKNESVEWETRRGTNTSDIRDHCLDFYEDTDLYERRCVCMERGIGRCGRKITYTEAAVRRACRADQDPNFIAMSAC